MAKDNNKKDSKPSFKSRLAGMTGMNHDLADTVVNFFIPEAIDVILALFPDTWFNNIFAKRQLLWKYGGLVMGFLIRKYTNLSNMADEVVTEVSREIVQGVERRIVQKGGKVGSQSGEFTPSAKDRDDLTKIMSVIAASDLIKEDPNVKPWDEFNKLKTYFTDLKPKQKERFMKVFAETSPLDFIKFISMEEASRESFLDFFFKQPEVPEKNYLKEYYGKAKTFVKTNAQKIDNTLAEGQPLGNALRDLFRIPNSN